MGVCIGKFSYSVAAAMCKKPNLVVMCAASSYGFIRDTLRTPEDPGLPEMKGDVKRKNHPPTQCKLPRQSPFIHK